MHRHHARNHVVVRLPILGVLDKHWMLDVLRHREHVFGLQFHPVGVSFLSGLRAALGGAGCGAGGGDTGGAVGAAQAVVCVLRLRGGDRVIIVQSAVVNDVAVLVVLDSVMAAVMQLGGVRASVKRAVVSAVRRAVAVAVMPVCIVVVPVASVRTVRRMVVRVVVMVPMVRVVPTMSTVCSVWMLKMMVAMTVVPSVAMPVSVMVSVMTMTIVVGPVRSVSAMAVIRRAAVVAVRVVLIQHRIIFCEKQTRRGAFVFAPLTGRRRAYGAVLAGLAVVLSAGLALFVGVHAALGHGLLLLNDDLLGPLGHSFEVFAVVFFALEADVPAIPHNQQTIVGDSHQVVSLRALLVTAPQTTVVHTVDIWRLHYTQVGDVTLLLEQKLACFHAAAVLRAHCVQNHATLHAQRDGQKGLFFHCEQLGGRVVRGGFVLLVALVTRGA
mmetsp:Transcript_42786/g.74392  ORF Transcript_42786/g.74392 Transcript_42786/m.74392 type:complete len:439 (-) Transcript_42786:387-1703(-)